MDVACTNPIDVSRTRSLTLVAAALFGAARPVSADPLAVKTEGDLPFSEAELEAALAVRTAIAAPEASRSITATVVGEGAAVHVTVLGRERVLVLEGAHGVDAARLVAFAIFDLAGDQLDPPEAPRHLAPPMRRVDPAVRLDDGVAIPARTHVPRATLGMWGRGGTRTEGELELGVAIAGPIRALVSSGAGTLTHVGLVAATAVNVTAATFRTYPVRAGLAWRGPALWGGQLEARASAIALVETASAQLARTDTVYGGGGAVAWAAPILGLDARGGATVTFGAGVDGFATANEYRFAAMPVTTTPRIAWWAGLGLAAELWR